MSTKNLTGQQQVSQIVAIGRIASVKGFDWHVSKCQNILLVKRAALHQYNDSLAFTGDAGHLWRKRQFLPLGGFKLTTSSNQSSGSSSRGDGLAGDLLKAGLSGTAFVGVLWLTTRSTSGFRAELSAPALRATRLSSKQISYITHGFSKWPSFSKPFSLGVFLLTFVGSSWFSYREWSKQAHDCVGHVYRNCSRS